MPCWTQSSRSSSSQSRSPASAAQQRVEELRAALNNKFPHRTSEQACGEGQRQQQRKRRRREEKQRQERMQREEEKRRQERMRREGTRCHASPHRTRGALLVPENHNRLQDFKEVSTTSIHHSCISLGVFTAPKTWGARVGFPMGLTTLSFWVADVKASYLLDASAAKPLRLASVRATGSPIVYGSPTQVGRASGVTFGSPCEGSRRLGGPDGRSLHEWPEERRDDRHRGEEVEEKRRRRQKRRPQRESTPSPHRTRGERRRRRRKQRPQGEALEQCDASASPHRTRGEAVLTFEEASAGVPSEAFVQLVRRRIAAAGFPVGGPRPAWMST